MMYTGYLVCLTAQILMNTSSFIYQREAKQSFPFLEKNDMTTVAFSRLLA